MQTCKPPVCSSSDPLLSSSFWGRALLPHAASGRSSTVRQFLFHAILVKGHLMKPVKYCQFAILFVSLISLKILELTSGAHTLCLSSGTFIVEEGNYLVLNSPVEKSKWWKTEASIQQPVRNWNLPTATHVNSEAGFSTPVKSWDYCIWCKTPNVKPLRFLIPQNLGNNMCLFSDAKYGQIWDDLLHSRRYTIQ